MGNVTIRRDDELERDYGKWVLVRKSLGVGAFGVNMVELPPGESIPEHDETERGQEEVFYVVSGAPTMVIDGDDFPVSQGTWIRLDPPVRRTVRNDADAIATVMIISAPTGSGYEPMGWA